MKRAWSDLTLLALGTALGFVVKGSFAAGVFSSAAFRIAFGGAAGVVLSLILGGLLLEAINRRQAKEFRKRVSISVDEGKTVMTIEPK